MIRKFTQTNGLSSYNIRKILQDRYGFIWLGTQEGLSRFDGINFVNYTKNGSVNRRISGSDVRDIVEDSSRNLIWALSSEEASVDAINIVNAKVEATIKIPGNDPEDYNLSIIKNLDELWVGSSTGVKILDSKKKRYLQKLRFPDKSKKSSDFTTQSMFRDDFGNVWVCYWGYGIVIYRSTDKSIIKSVRLTELAAASGADEIRIFVGVRSAKGEVLFGTSQGLRRIRYKKDYILSIDNSPCTKFTALNKESVDWLISDSDTTLLVSGNHSLSRFDNSLTHFELIEEYSRTYETNWLSSVLCMLRDRSGNIWLGCQEGLAYLKKGRSPFRPYNRDSKSLVKLDHVFAVSPLTNNKILVGLRSGLVEIDNDRGKYQHFDKNHLYQYVFTDLRGRVHVSRQEGLFIYKQGRIVPAHLIYPEFKPYASYSLNSHLSISDTLIILGTENNQGLLVWNPLRKAIRVIGTKGVPALTSNIVNNIYRDSSGRIWVLSDNGITVISADLRQGKKIEITGKGTHYGLFFSICEVARSYYIASYGSGILEIDQSFRLKRIFNTQNGLSNNGVYQVYAIPGGKLLVTSNNGLSRVDLVSLRINCFYQNDGLHSNAFEEASGRSVQGKIYTGGVNGFTEIDPRYFLPNTTPPQLYLTGAEIKTDEGAIAFSDLSMKKLNIPSDALQTSILFSGLNYQNPERTSYAYRILEESENWIDNGTQASLVLIGHPPGEYTLEIKAANEELIWSRPVKLNLYFQPKWYQTWWFRILIAAILLGMIYQFYRFRIGQLQREHAIRQRLATDLHDDLGSTINSISIYASLALMEGDTKWYLSHIKQGAQDSIAIIRDIIWILDDRNDTIGQLADRIYQFGNPLCEAKGIMLRIDIDPKLEQIVFQKQEKRNLYMIIKEAINNSIKYAGAKQMLVSFQRREQKSEITVSDDGTGFDTDVLRPGNGLNNMQRRAREIGYEFEIESSPDAGTTIRLINKAFR